MSCARGRTKMIAGIDRDFKDELLNNLNKLRQSNVLCDITVRSEGQGFSAHRCVLSAASPYFRAYFTSQFQKDRPEQCRRAGRDKMYRSQTSSSVHVYWRSKIQLVHSASVVSFPGKT